MQIDNQPPVLFQKNTVEYSDTGFFGKIVCDYLSQNAALKPYYNRFPKLEAFEAQMLEKKESYTHRSALVEALGKQYAQAKLKCSQLDVLIKDNCFTITTGHQVCLFTGPLYFIYKIVSTINTCKALKEKYPEKIFVPVFWMATEDHDFAEANHFVLPKGKIEWESGQGGAVGRMRTVGMDALFEELKELIGVGYRAAELTQLFSDAYVKHDSIAEATRYLVDKLFGKHGVVVVDGDDPSLKALMTPYFEKDIFSNTAFTSVSDTSARLGMAYKKQVTPREINLFYLKDELRARLVETEDGDFEVLNSSLRFSKSELQSEMRSNPERFSPNVILRPLYQEVILPNLAYIGGGGELAYWFQLKEMFQQMEVSFPMLMLRNSVGVLSANNVEVMRKSGITISDLFGSALDMERKFLGNEKAVDLSLSKEAEKIENVFSGLANRLAETDPSLDASAKSGLARTQRIVSNLEKKLERAARRQHSDAVAKFEKLQSSFVINGGLQERVYNFSYLYLQYGEEFIDRLIDELDPFEERFTVLAEELTR